MPMWQNLKIGRRLAIASAEELAKNGVPLRNQASAFLKEVRT